MMQGRIGRDRRAGERLPAADCLWLSSARLRPGPEVSVEDLSAGGARIDTPVRLLPGGRVELVLSGPGWHWSVDAVVVHASVSGLTRHGPRYVAGLHFGRRLEIALLCARRVALPAG